jgi:hypothetical protein
MAVATNASVNAAVGGTMAKIISAIIYPIVLLVFGLAILLFIWGAAGLILNRDNPEKRAESQTHILWGVIGLFIMTGVYGIIRVIAGTIGVPAPF